MKKGLLLVSIFLASQTSFGQLTEANEPAVGASNMMFVVDTMDVTLASILAVTGTDVEWNYTTVGMNSSSTSAIAVEAAASTPNGVSFPASAKAITQGTILQYFSSTPTERVSQGYVFNEPTMGEVVVTFENDPARLMTYPFNYGTVNTDTYSGSTTLMGGAVTASVTGEIHSTIDGTGTLKLPGGLDVPNVFRVTTIDTTTADAGMMTVEVIRVQFEYYDLNDGELPVFVDAYLSISGVGEQRQVLSKNFATVGLSDNTIENVVMYPNPSNGSFTIKGNFSKGNVEVTDLTGKTVYAAEISSGTNIVLNDVKSGVYMVKLSANDKTSVQKITIK